MEGFKTQAMKKPRTNDLHLRPSNQSLNSKPTPNKPAIEKSAVLFSPTKSTLSVVALLPTAAVHTSSCFFSATTVYNTSDFSSRSSPVSENAHILPVNASQPQFFFRKLYQKYNNLVSFLLLSSYLICYVTSENLLIIIVPLIVFVPGS